MRLAKFLATSGVASRRAADELIRAGRVTVAGEVVTNPASDVDSASGVAFDGKLVGIAARELVVYAVNKPAGVVSTASDPQRRPTVVQLVGGPLRLYPVGRLDAESPAFLAPAALATAGIGGVLPQLLDAYRTGGGVPYSAFACVK